jgi:hypothetical protein
MVWGLMFVGKASILEEHRIAVMDNTSFDGLLLLFGGNPNTTNTTKLHENKIK